MTPTPCERRTWTGSKLSFVTTNITQSIPASPEPKPKRTTIFVVPPFLTREIVLLMLVYFEEQLLEFNRNSCNSRIRYWKAKITLRKMPSKNVKGKKKFAHCLKITQNVAFEFLTFWHFPPIFGLLKLTCLVTLFDRKLQVFKNSPILEFLINFCPLKMYT